MSVFHVFGAPKKKQPPPAKRIPPLERLQKDAEEIELRVEWSAEWTHMMLDIGKMHENICQSLKRAIEKHKEREDVIDVDLDVQSENTLDQYIGQSEGIPVNDVYNENMYPREYIKLLKIMKTMHVQYRDHSHIIHKMRYEEVELLVSSINKVLEHWKDAVNKSVMLEKSISEIAKVTMQRLKERMADESESMRNADALIAEEESEKALAERERQKKLNRAQRRSHNRVDSQGAGPSRIRESVEIDENLIPEMFRRVREETPVIADQTASSDQLTPDAPTGSLDQYITPPDVPSSPLDELIPPSDALDQYIPPPDVLDQYNPPPDVLDQHIPPSDVPSSSLDQHIPPSTALDQYIPPSTAVDRNIPPPDPFVDEPEDSLDNLMRMLMNPVDTSR